MKLLKIALVSTTLACLPGIVFAVKSAQYTCPESGAGTGEITSTVSLSATGGFTGWYVPKEKLTFSKADIESSMMGRRPTCYYTTTTGETVKLQIPNNGCRKVTANSFMCD